MGPRGRLHEIDLPTLFVHGVDDPAIPVAAAREAASLVRNSEFVAVGNAGHWVQRDQPHLVAEAIISFLRRGL